MTDGTKWRAGGGSTPLTDLLQQLLHCCTGCQMQDASWKLGAAGCCRIEASWRSCIFMHLVQLERVLRWRIELRVKDERWERMMWKMRKIALHQERKIRFVALKVFIFVRLVELLRLGTSWVCVCVSANFCIEASVIFHKKKWDTFDAYGSSCAISSSSSIRWTWGGKYIFRISK